MRPLGDIARALLEHAGTPGTVREVCQRAQVGYAVGAYTATRLLMTGRLERAEAPVHARAGRGRPPMLVQAAQPEDEESTLSTLQRAFWPRRPTALEWDAL
jgi:hypothetical protein